MSEIQKDPIWKKAATTAAILSLPVAGAIGIGQNISSASEAAQAKKNDLASAEALAAKESYENSIKDAIEATYDSAHLIDSFTADASNYDKLWATAENIIIEHVGEPYLANQERLTEILGDSAKHFSTSVQLGDTYYVKQVEIDGNLDNGQEYVVTNLPPRGPIVDELPAPTQAGQETQN